MLEDMALASPCEGDRISAFMNSALRRGSTLALQDAANFQFSASLTELGCLRVCRVETDPHVVISGGLSPLQADEVDLGYNILLPLSGELCILLPDRRIQLHAPQWCLLNREPTPHRVVIPKASAFLVLVLPRSETDSLSRELRRLTLRPLEGRHGAGRLFRDLVRNAAEELPSLPMSRRVAISDAILHLFRVTVRDMLAVSRPSSQQQSVYQRICSTIDGNISDPKFSIGAIADALGYSRRYVHMVFSMYNPDTTLSTYIRSRRLARCRDEMLMGRLDQFSVAEIAYSWGFNDPSYFGRMFRREFGLSPGAFLSRSKVNGGTD